jgi:regulator of cell morphogenesis and NO signaling
MIVKPEWTVNELLARLPESAALLNRLGIDMCCGGSLTLSQAAASVGVTTDALLADLDRTPGPRQEGNACSIP